MLNLAVLFLTLGIVCGSVQAVPYTLENIRQSLAKELALRASFMQKKIISGLAKPIISQGTLVLLKGNFIMWRTEKPFPNEILLNDKGIFQCDKYQQKTSLMKGGPQDGQILDILSNLLKGDFKQIHEFDVTLLQDSSYGWKIQLTPLGSLAEFITSIQVEGQQFIHQISICCVNGDRNEITLTNHITGKDIKELF